MADFINPIGTLFAINADAPIWVRQRLKGRGGMCTRRAWRCLACTTHNGELYFTFENAYGYNETLPSKYFHLFN